MRAGKNKELDNLLINLNENPEPPNFSQAKMHRNRFSMRSEPLTVLGIHEYSKFGPGVKLYFALLKNLAGLFLLLFIASLPSMIVNYHGNGLSLYGNSWQQAFLRLSLSNQESLDLASDELSLQQQLARVRDVKFNQIIIIFNDLFCSLIILAFLIFWRIQSKDIVSQLLSKNAPPSYHTLLVDLPLEIQDERLLEHFSQFGEVQQVEYVRDYGDFLLELKDFLKMIEDYGQELDRKKKEILYDQIGEKYDSIKKFYRSISQAGNNHFPRIKAFVSFQDHELAQRVHGLYKYNIKSMNLSIDGHQMKVRKCLVEPLSIIWENFHLKDHSEYLRGCLFITIVILLLLLTLFGIFVLSLHANGMAGTDDTFSSSKIQANVTFAEAQKSNDTSVIQSFCATLTYKNFQWRYYQLCSDYFKRFEQHWFYVGTLALVVSIVTIILIKIVFAMTELRRFRTLPEKRRFMILSILLTYLVSSSLLALLIRAEIKWQGGSFSLVKWVQSSFPQLSVRNNVEVYNEMSRKWYMEIGKLLLANYFLTLNLFPWLYVIEEWVMQRIRALWAWQARTQKIMNTRILDCEFYWQFYYAVQLNSMYFCLFFSTAMPILYLLAFLSLLSLFLTNKVILKWFNRQPQPFDHKLNTFISHAFSVALVLHQLASLFTLSVNQIFPANQPQLISFTGCKIIYAIFTFGLLIVLFNLKVISEFVEKRLCKKRQDLMITQQINSTLGAERKQKKRQHRSPSKFQNSYLSSYKMQDNPYYNNISYTLLILQQVISDQPMQILADFNLKSSPERPLCTSLHTPLGSKFIQINASESDRNLSF